MTTHESLPKRPRPLFIVSIDVKTCYERLVKTSIGDLVSYSELESLLGRTVREKGAWILSSARRRAFVQDNMVFAVIPKQGVKRLSDAEIVDSSNDALVRVHKASLRAARRLGAVRDFESLSSQQKIKYNLQASAFGLLAHLTKESQLKKLESKVQAATKSLPLQRTLDAFRE